MIAGDYDVLCWEDVLNFAIVGEQTKAVAGGLPVEQKKAQRIDIGYPDTPIRRAEKVLSRQGASEYARHSIGLTETDLILGIRDD